MLTFEARAIRKVSFNEDIERHPYDVTAYLKPDFNMSTSTHRP
jgi:hypothetical protein